MAQAYCSNCGAKLSPDAKFCGSCGSIVQAASPTANPETSTGKSDEAHPSDPRTEVLSDPQPPAERAPGPVDGTGRKLIIVGGIVAALLLIVLVPLALSNSSSPPVNQSLPAVPGAGAAPESQTPGGVTSNTTSPNAASPTATQSPPAVPESGQSGGASEGHAPGGAISNTTSEASRASGRPANAVRLTRDYLVGHWSAHSCDPGFVTILNRDGTIGGGGRWTLDGDFLDLDYGNIPYNGRVEIIDRDHIRFRGEPRPWRRC